MSPALLGARVPTLQNHLSSMAMRLRGLHERVNHSIGALTV